MTTPETEHHDGTSDATPGGYDSARRPGELGFAVFLFVVSLVLLWNAYGISGFDKLSSPGSIPMATSLVMAVTAGIVLLRTLRLPRVSSETLMKDILPPVAILFAALLVGYAMLLKPLGFLPTSVLFLVVAIKVLSRRSWAFTLIVSLGSLVVIWLIFRIVFTVLMPAGIVPEAEFVQLFRDLFGGSAK
ncbi:tripartite tricarboxylate transporter TctB family protein [Maliponia aquimaris]|uniref:Tripartite tricarboxylate transporter TctB family protein n=1 Tax=Maliponia aquimaris TaxID=1673631 RepID=A0A238L0H3_9RHOB|nr:tripartite tricarboxylate transporter TctB family protein [Maliponia aquimaris]SMX48584.1 Tripartite tricarboxylate transporter TctB family protein [Maliponia aquimaris]